MSTANERQERARQVVDALWAAARDPKKTSEWADKAAEAIRRERRLTRAKLERTATI